MLDWPARMNTLTGPFAGGPWSARTTRIARTFMSRHLHEGFSPILPHGPASSHDPAPFSSRNLTGRTAGAAWHRLVILRHGPRPPRYARDMRRVALAIDLDWPVPHHQGIVAGALQVGREKGWACEVHPFLGSSPSEPSRVDGVIGRVTRELARWAAR